MAYFVEKLLTPPEKILSEIPLSEKLANQVQSDRKIISDIIEGKDKRKLLIIGPCSAWPESAVIDYAKELKSISDKFSDKIKIVLRVYTQKPRTTLGWTGSVNQPDPFASPDIEAGIKYCRKLMIKILEIGFPIADELLFTHNTEYFSDLISWFAIGARSSEDQEHRVFASMLNCPVGLKNPSSGSISTAVNSVISAQSPHVFLLNSKQIRTKGNPFAHIVLRGGDGKSNLYLEDLQKLNSILKHSEIKNKAVIADVSHDNSIDPSSAKKDPLKQPEVLLRLVEHLNQFKELDEMIKGFMFESFIKTGNQNISNAKSIKDIDMGGLSITDGCVGIKETKILLEKLYKML